MERMFCCLGLSNRLGLGGMESSRFLGWGHSVKSGISPSAEQSNGIPLDISTQFISLAGAGMEEQGAKHVPWCLFKLWNLGKFSWAASHSPDFPSIRFCIYANVVCWGCGGGLDIRRMFKFMELDGRVCLGWKASNGWRGWGQYLEPGISLHASWRGLMFFYFLNEN